MMLFEQAHYVAIEPSLQLTCLGIPGHLAQVVLITRGLTIVVVLFIKSLTTKRYVTGLRMRDLVAHVRTEGFEQAPRAHQIGKLIEVMLAVKPHGQVASDVHPQGHVVSGARRGISFRQLGQDLSLGNGSEEVRFADLADSIDVIKLATAKGL